MHPVRAAVAEALGRTTGALYVGFSGGRDSTVLLHATAAGRTREVVAVHVNHGLHPDAGRWQEHCRALARALDVGFLARRVAVPARGSLEARAREARYAVFGSLLEHPDTTLLLAHHHQDQTETVLLRLLQGRGLYGMPERRPLAHGLLVRPLLHVAPAALEDYARAHGLTWIEDPANADPALDRNFVRHQVLPALRRRWPDVDRAVVQAMESHRLAERQLTAPAGPLAQTGSLAVALLRGREPGEAVEVLRLWLEAHALEIPPRRALAELLRQTLQAGAGRTPRLEVGAARLQRFADRLHLVRPGPRLQDEYPLRLPGVTELPHGRLEVVSDRQGFQPTGAVRVRFRRGGERLQDGPRHRPLKSLLQEAGVPPWERERVPLLFDDAGLLAVPGIAWRRGRQAAPGPGWRVSWHSP